MSRCTPLPRSLRRGMSGPRPKYGPLGAARRTLGRKICNGAWLLLPVHLSVYVKAMSRSAYAVENWFAQVACRFLPRGQGVPRRLEHDGSFLE